MSTTEYLLKIAIHAVPGARRTEAAGSHGDALRVRLAAPPVDGKANAALIAWAARAFGVGKGQVDLVYGTSGRHKLLAVSFASAQIILCTVVSSHITLYTVEIYICSKFFTFLREKTFIGNCATCIFKFTFA